MPCSTMTLLGIGTVPAVFGLWAATLLPIVRNTYAGLRAVPPHLVEAAIGMPSGCPSAIAPPLRFTRASSSAMPSARSTASPCDANASFSSMTSNCSCFRPVRRINFCDAGAGPIPMAGASAARWNGRSIAISGCSPRIRAGFSQK